MAIFSSNKVVHATYSAGETFWNVTECKGNEGKVFIVQKHTNYDITKIEAEFKTKKAAIDYCKKAYDRQYDTEVKKSEWLYKWAERGCR